jgi:hypothetical protein
MILETPQAMSDWMCVHLHYHASVLPGELNERSAPHSEILIRSVRSIPIASHRDLDVTALLAFENPLPEFAEARYEDGALHGCPARRTSGAHHGWI